MLGVALQPKIDASHPHRLAQPDGEGREPALFAEVEARQDADLVMAERLQRGAQSIGRILELLAHAPLGRIARLLVEPQMSERVFEQMLLESLDPDLRAPDTAARRPREDREEACESANAPQRGNPRKDAHHRSAQEPPVQEGRPTPRTTAMLPQLRPVAGPELHPVPRVRVRPWRPFFSTYSMIIPAMSLPVAASMPSRPGEELTSMTTGPWFERRMSTPATLSPMILAERTAVERSSGVILISLEEPPRCRLERN